MAVAWYLMDQVKSDRLLYNIATRALCYVKSWMTVGEQRTDEVDY